MSRQWLAFLVGMALGLGLWLAIPDLAGIPSPWEGGYRYMAALALAGAAVGLIDPAGVWPGPAGIYAGQALALVVQSVYDEGGQDQPVPVQLLFLVSLTLAAVLGTAATAALRAWTIRERQEPPAPPGRPSRS